MGESLRSATLRTQKEYARRLNAALDYIDRNIVGDMRCVPVKPL